MKPCLLLSSRLRADSFNLGIITFLSGGLADIVTHSGNNLKIFDLVRISFNLLIIGPLFYDFITKNICQKKSKKIYQTEVFGLVFIHALFYKFFHEQMHKRFFNIHKYHHSFHENISISAANAVSVSEFIFAYMSPFLIGSSVIVPTSESLNLAASIISFFNFAVHCDKLYDIDKWVPSFVTPKLHINHHKRMHPSTLCAPTFNFC